MRSLITLAALIVLSGCADIKSANLMPPPQKFESVQLKAGGLGIEFSPKVDILFVLDNSNSMDAELGLLRRNMSTFANSFADNPLIDFHIGVVTVHDSSKYKGPFLGPQRIPEKTTADVDDEQKREVRNQWERQVFKFHPDTNEQQYRENGELKEVNGSRYVTRENYGDLEKFFEIKTDFVARNVETFDEEGNFTGFSQTALGPEIEESFSPVIQGLTSPALLRSSNRGFLRSDAHLVVIFVTDAEDSSKTLDPKSMFTALYDLKRQDISKLSIYGVICTEGDDRCRNLMSNGVDTIEKDPKRIRELITIAAEKRREAELLNEIEPQDTDINPIMNLRSSSWGEQLAHIGDDIRKRTIEKRISLGDRIPEFDQETNQPMIEVMYGDSPLPYDEVVGWTWDASSNSITIHDGIDIESLPPASGISIRLKKVNKGPSAKKI